MRNDGPGRKAAFLAKVALRVLDDLLVRVQGQRMLWRKHFDVAKYCEEPVQCGPIAEKRMTATCAKQYVAIYDLFVDALDDDPCACEPPLSSITRMLRQALC